ncbi:hypothetical protein tb265_21370 [Gemmatimonadetes bacterium T265]|nr:hypothetical protein tb265_21370 [Gemmatimonadetes bacterium T265]
MPDDRTTTRPADAAPTDAAPGPPPVQVHVDVSSPQGSTQAQAPGTNGPPQSAPAPGAPAPNGANGSGTAGGGTHVVVDVQLPAAPAPPAPGRVRPPDPRPDAPPNGAPGRDGKPHDDTSRDGKKSDEKTKPDDKKSRDQHRDNPKPVRRRSLIIGALVVLAALAGFLLLGILPRRSRDKQLRQQEQQSARNDSVPAVTVVKVASGDSAAEFTLPGNVQGLREAAVFARATGYVRRFLVDIGQRVRAGQVLAVLDAPDVEEQLREARANEAQAEAALRLARVELARFRILYRDSVVTREELDQRQATYEANQASVAAAQANVRRLGQLVGYASVTAPFRGVVTARNVDEGVLVGSGGGSTTTSAAGLGGNTILASGAGQATSAGGTGSTLGGSGGALGGGSSGAGAGGGGAASGGVAGSGSLFRVSQADTVRLYVGVPQSYAGDVRVGIPATVHVPDMPQRTFRGKVVRTAGALDAATRTLLTEVDVPNLDGRLLPGMYATVNFHVVRASPPASIPAGALLVRQQGAQAAVVGSDSVLQIRTISVGRDYGSAMEVLTGLKPGENVVVNPTDELRNGQRVRPRPQPAEGAPGGNTPGGRPANPPAPKAENGQGGKGGKGGDGNQGGQKPQGGQGAGSAGGGTGQSGQQGGSGSGSGQGSGQQGGGQQQGQGAGQQGGGNGGAQGGSQQAPIARLGAPGKPSGSGRP